MTYNREDDKPHKIEPAGLTPEEIENLNKSDGKTSLARLPDCPECEGSGFGKGWLGQCERCKGTGQIG